MEADRTYLLQKLIYFILAFQEVLSVNSMIFVDFVCLVNYWSSLFLWIIKHGMLKEYYKKFYWARVHISRK
jgi:hypothetical protein